MCVFIRNPNNQKIHKKVTTDWHKINFEKENILHNR